MSIFYSNFIRLCNANGYKPTQVTTALGLSRGTQSNWKTRGTLPNDSTLMMIADFFSVDKEFLLSEHNDADFPKKEKTHWETVVTPDEIDVLKYNELESKVKKLECDFENVQKKYAATQSSSANDSPERTEARRIVESVPEEQLEMLIRIWKAASGIS